MLTLLLALSPVWAQDTAIQLDGDGDYVDLGAFTPGAAFTVEGWVQWDELYVHGCCDALIEAVDSSGYNSFGIMYNGSSWQVEVNDNTTSEGDSCGDGVALCVTDSPSTGTPIHVAAVVDGGDVSLYLDGALAGSQSFSSGPSIGGDSWILGADSDGTPYSSDNVTGAMDEWRVWDSARSAADVACLKDWGLTGAEPGLLTHWGMNDGTGSTAVDGTGGGQDGTLSGDASWVTSPMGLTASAGGDIGCLDFDGDGETPDDGDCDDADPAVNTAAAEVCDGIDNDCDGVTDPDDSDDAGTWYGDSDGDGVGDVADPQSACAQPSNTVENADDDCPAEDASACDTDADGCLDDSDADGTSDCDDAEECDGQDNDGDGLVDDDDPDVSGTSTWYADSDADGFGDPGVTLSACDAPSGTVADSDDCDDGDSAVNPDAAEVCDGIDNDCDGVTDPDDSTDAGTWYSDSDGDGLGDGGDPQSACTQPANTVENTDDACPAEDASACDSNADGCLDDSDADGTSDCDDAEECDGQDNDGDGLVDDDDPDVSGTSTWYADGDSDGYGDAATSSSACDGPSGTVADSTDCDDGDASVNPGAAELWYDGVDQDCDGNDDDQDGDGHAWDGVAGGDDCDDTDETVHPGAIEVWYDGVDGDCAGDDDDDADGDGHASASHGGDDCDDDDSETYPGAPDEPYDGVITDCDDADEFDQDGDGWSVDDDCDDNNSGVNPDADEIWYDGLDQDCDGNDDDQDGDGYTFESDCDDTDPAVFPGSPGLDEDCASTDTADSGWGETGLGDSGGGDGKDDDCGCATQRSPSGTWAMLLLAGAVLRRRRGRAA